MSATKHSPEIKLAAAKRELDAAFDACPHWDFEDDEPCHAECCYRLDDARRAVRKARKSVERGTLVAL